MGRVPGPGGGAVNPRGSEAAYTNVLPDEVEGWLGRGARLVDVRERWEYVKGHLPGAENVPLGELPRWTAGDTYRPLVLVCASGNRSGKAAKRLAKDGRREVANLVGGTSGWAARGLPIVTGELPGVASVDGPEGRA